MKLIILLLSLCALATAKRLTRSDFYIPPSNRYLQQSYQPTQPSFQYIPSTPSPFYNPIYESSTPRPVTPVYHQQPVISSTPLPHYSSTPAPPVLYDQPDNYISITESTRPRFFNVHQNEYNDARAQYVPPIVQPSPTPFAAPVSRSYVTTNRYVPTSPYSGSATNDYGIYQYAPAFYNYEYGVNAPEYGVNFGHKEARQGDVTSGSYHVLLPDGRLQIVDYTADSTGYHPRIRYVYVGAAGLNGYY